MSDKASWTERTGLTAGWGKPGAAPALAGGPSPAPELVVNRDQGDADPFLDRREYDAVRSIMGRSQDACFLDDDGMPHLKPWAYFLGAEAHPAHRGITLHWPGVRVEVKGENLREIYLRIMTRRADVWRTFNSARHDVPKADAPIIRSIRVVVENDVG